MPLSVSTRASRTVSSPTCAAPGLNTTLHGYGQSAAVRIGFASCRTNSSRGRGVTLAPRRARALRREAAGQGGRVDHRLGAVERERRLGALVAVQVVDAEAVAAAAGREVVQRPVEAVPPEEPVERRAGADGVLRVAAGGERGQLGLDERAGVERLLVAVARCAARRDAGPRGRPAAASRRRARTRRRASAATPGPTSTASSRPSRAPPDDQRVRQAGVVVGQAILEPAPVRIGLRPVRLEQLLDEALEQRAGAGLEPVGIEPREPDARVRRGAQRDLAVERVDEVAEHPSGRDDDARRPGGGQHLAEGAHARGRRGRRRAARPASGGRSP